MSETMTELKPCPFCGSPHVADRYVRDGQQVFCTDCGASAPPAFHGPNGDTEERATAAWNRRAPDAASLSAAEARGRDAAAITLGDEDDVDGLQHALTIAAMGAPFQDVQGNLYMCARYKSDEYRDAEFRDYGLARAARVIFNNADRLAAAIRKGLTP